MPEALRRPEACTDCRNHRLEPDRPAEPVHRCVFDSANGTGYVDWVSGMPILFCKCGRDREFWGASWA